jgi:hypothetical protein
MNDLVDRLRVSAEPVGKLLLEAADALQAAQGRITELTETLRAMVEIGNSQRSREFADVKKALTKARVLLSAGSVVSPAPAMPVMSPAPAQGSSPEIAPVAPPEPTNHREEEIVSGMYKEIQNLLRYSA